ncbi:hypothetical protein KVR01_013227 [Diaporthe batatas]|uniref:uncharacterized protein n=1 Tax=Diaporthe batatas TaxID=748121 RepID=UPI001D03EB5B|nr:uncharacterized protein KVR01_013227 [Diaporthe batatas]KAG8157005.1 hypothetical protein KVR01_013227 [Diaporthe batatas]
MANNNERSMPLQTPKRDVLVEAEKKYQKLWAETKVFEASAISTNEIPPGSLSPADLRAQRPKFFATVPYPYSNGSLHLGHAFTISKADFSTRYARMQGKNVLFPFAFHCTGMPIKAAADRLTMEIELFGKNFERYDTEGPNDEHVAVQGSDKPQTDINKFRSRKSKAAARTTNAHYQFQIMLAQGIPREDIHLFADARHWVRFFPAAGKCDAMSFGLGVDWRRSFVTTEANPFYDSFVRWQMNKLYALGKIRFGKRYTVYSPKDGQACMDHDRSEGEGVNVQEYTAIKMRVLAWPEQEAGSAQQPTAASSTIASKLQVAGLPNDAEVYFVAATLRPETVYGQTCCFVGPTAKYAIFSTGKDNEYLFISERAARNMSFQGVFACWGHYDKVLELSGAEVIGTRVDAPLSAHRDGVRVLPMEIIEEAKGTGVVICVPSDNPADYASTVELSTKPEYYGIQREWAALKAVPIIETPAYGSLTAHSIVSEMSIRSPKDPRLAEAQKIADKQGVRHGTMLIGPFSGRPVQEAQGLVKHQLVDGGHAFPYAEPDGRVTSRSRDVCVAAHLDQWYLNYGTAENGGDGAWSAQVQQHLRSLNTFSSEAKQAFEATLGWMGQWACARSYGLGTQLPWDSQFLVESLSDSTIYQAYYTVAHYLHSDMYGKHPGIGGITADQMTDAVWDYVFARADRVDSEIPLSTLQAMRREFEYWYPVDLRVSGKDLIQNHLTFFLYIHVAMWPSEFWPRAIRTNGHLLLNGEKMSKSTGNFLTLRETIERFGADAARIAIADAGDGMDDANFEESVANKTVLKLYELRKWIEETLDTRDANAGEALRTGNDEMCFWDELFQNHLHHLVADATAQYDQCLFKAALRSCFYGLTAARDFYRDAVKAAGITMHHGLVRRYAELQALVLAPLAPHWAEHIWLEVLGQKSSIQTARWPETPPADAAWMHTLDYIQTTLSNVAAAESQQHKKLAKGKKTTAGTDFNPKSPFEVTIFFTRALPTWKDYAMNLVCEALDELNIVDMADISRKVPAKDRKRAMPFINALKSRLDAGEDRNTVLYKALPFDEGRALVEMIPVLRHMMQPRCGSVRAVEVSRPQGGGDTDGVKAVEVASGEAWPADTEGRPTMIPPWHV